MVDMERVKVTATQILSSAAGRLLFPVAVCPLPLLPQPPVCLSTLEALCAYSVASLLDSCIIARLLHTR